LAVPAPEVDAGPLSVQPRLRQRPQVLPQEQRALPVRRPWPRRFRRQVPASLLAALLVSEHPVSERLVLVSRQQEP
jgi:hypothetical protein